MDLILCKYFLCVAVPLAAMLILLDPRPRLLLIFVIIGAFQFVFSQTVVSVILSAFPGINSDFVMTTYAPLIFELSKAVPIAYYSFVSSADRKTLINLSISIGAGFAVLESLYTLSSGDAADMRSIVLLIVIYVLINLVCTGFVGVVITYVISNPARLFFSVVGLFSIPTLLHGIVRIFIEAHSYLIATAICIILYIPIMIAFFKNEKKERINLRLKL